MRARFAFGLVVLLLLAAGNVSPQADSVIVLPSPGLLTCSVANCTDLWAAEANSPGAVFPIQLNMDIAKGCIYGFRARYSSEIPFATVQAAIDRKYGSFGVQLRGDREVPLKLWRVTPEKFAIQLSQATEKSDRETLDEVFKESWTKPPQPDKSKVTGIDVIYMRFMPVGTPPQARCDVQP